MNKADQDMIRVSDLKKLSAISERFLQMVDEDLDYQQICDDMLEVSGAKYAIFNLYDAEGHNYATVAISGNQGLIKKASKVMGLEFVGQERRQNPKINEKIKDQTITRFSNLIELAGNSLPKAVLSQVEKAFNIGECYFVKISKNAVLLGDFQLIMEKNQPFSKEVVVELYSRQIGLLITRKRAEEAIKQEKLFNEALLEVVPGYLYVYDQAGKLIRWNKKHETMTGYTADELSHMTLDNWFEGEDAVRVAATVEQVFKTGYGEVEANLLIKDGKKMHVLSNGVRLTLDGKAYFTGVGIDITQRRRDEEALRESEQRYKFLFEDAGVGVSYYTPDGTVVFYNKKAAENMGGAPEDYAGKSLYDLFPRADADFYMDRVRKALSLDVTQEYTDFVPLLPGAKWFSSVFTRIVDLNGDVAGVQIISRDITEMKTIEEALRKNRDYLENLLNYANAPIIVWDASYKITIFNKAFEQLTGLSLEEVIGKSVDILFPEDKRKIFFALVKETSGGDRWESVEIEIQNRDGSIYTLLWNSATLYALDGKSIEATIAQGQDITGRKKAEEDLRKSEEKYRFITENASDVIWVLNLTQNKYTYISPSIKSLRGLTVEEAMTEKMEDSLTPESLKIVRGILADSVALFGIDAEQSGHYVTEIQQPCKNGEIIWVEVSTKLRVGQSGDLEVVGLSRNIDERKRAEEEVVYLSYHDHLTGLYNRRFYEEELRRLDTERNFPIVLIMADVNGLKLTNDAFGHKFGDQLLVKIAGVLKRACRSDEIVARIGGDEFVVLLPKTTGDEAKKLINRISIAIDKEKHDNIILSISMGFAIKESVSDQMDEVFKRAEDDMYRHKLSESSSMRSKTIDLIMSSLFEKNNREMHHSKRVSEICEAIATKMDFAKFEVNQIRTAGLMHDIGKIGVGNHILNKEGRLTSEEWEEIKRHSEVGYRILSSANEFSEIAGYVLAHQERWDGKGYPKGLKGEEIAVEARIIAVADAYDAMTSDRTYRKGLSEEEAIVEIERCAGHQFDPEIARIFVEQVLKK